MRSKLVIGLIAMCGAADAVGCGGETPPINSEVVTIDGTAKSQFVAATVTLPKNATNLAFDIDGDGTADNRLGNIIQAVASLGLNPQAAADTAVTSGTLILLVEAQSTDGTQQSATNAGAKVALGNKPAAPPAYDGTDAFTIASTTTPAQFYGNITAGTFTSNNPASTTNPITLTIGLPLVENQPPLLLPITGARITYKVGADGKITGGQINGAIKKTDVDAVVIPAVGVLITAELAKPDASPALAMFDPDGDGTVTAAEIMGNQLIAGLLGPDVQMFDGTTYKPNPAKTVKDSLTLGLGFTAVKASF